MSIKSPDVQEVRKLSEFELILELSASGWEFEFRKPSKNIPAYTPDSRKVWFYHTSTLKGGVNKRYLSALTVSSHLFAKGLAQIHHGQPLGYYECLLRVADCDLNSILPHQPKAYYTLMLDQYVNRKKKPRKGQAPTNDEPGGWVISLSRCLFVCSALLMFCVVIVVVCVSSSNQSHVMTKSCRLPVIARLTVILMFISLFFVFFFNGDSR